MVEEAGVRWTVRGVPMELREAAEQAAGGKHRLGDWLSGAIRRALENLPTAAGTVSEPPPYQARFDELTARVAALEAMIGSLRQREHKAEARGREAAAVPAAGQQATGRGGRRDKLPPEVFAQIDALAAKGTRQADIARELGVHRSVVSRHLNRDVQ